MQLIMATGNQNKVREIREMLEGTSFTILSMKDAGIEADIDENGTTFEENAVIKAETIRDLTGQMVLADDSGLEVECLNGEPGIYSARYCPKPGATDKDRRDWLLENIRKCGAPRPWKARFVCEIAIVYPEENKTLMAAGYCEGEIIPEERGSNGFGYDPIFFRPDLNKTLAELSEAEKNAISHRGNAIKKAKPYLIRNQD